MARSTFVSPRARNGSTGHSRNNDVSVTVNVTIPHGSRMKSYSMVRQATGSRRLDHNQGKKPVPRTGIGLGSSIRTPSSLRARARCHPGPQPRAPQPAREQRQPDRRHGQPRARGDKHHDVHEAEDRDRQVGEEVRDLLPRLPAEREAWGRQPVAVGRLVRYVLCIWYIRRVRPYVRGLRRVRRAEGAEGADRGDAFGHIR